MGNGSCILDGNTREHHCPRCCARDFKSCRRYNCVSDTGLIEAPWLSPQSVLVRWRSSSFVKYRLLFQQIPTQPRILTGHQSVLPDGRLLRLRNTLNPADLKWEL